MAFLHVIRFKWALNFGEPHHKDSDVWSWFDANRHWLEVHQLPPSSPELNPTERLWRYTAKQGLTIDTSPTRKN
jgi:transposase